MTAPAEVILTDDRGRGPLGHPRPPYMRFEDEDGVITLHPIPTDVTRAEALMRNRNPREAARIASSLNAAAADSGVTADLPPDHLRPPPTRSRSTRTKPISSIAAPLPRSHTRPWRQT